MLILGLRSSKKRSLLDVNEHFESERNDKVALLDSFFYLVYKRLFNSIDQILKLTHKATLCLLGGIECKYDCLDSICLLVES